MVRLMTIGVAAGGLLCGVDAAKAPDLVARLRSAGFTDAAVIGEVASGGGSGVPLIRLERAGRCIGE